MALQGPGLQVRRPKDRYHLLWLLPRSHHRLLLLVFPVMSRLPVLARPLRYQMMDGLYVYTCRSHGLPRCGTYSIVASGLLGGSQSESVASSMGEAF